MKQINDIVVRIVVRIKKAVLPNTSSPKGVGQHVRRDWYAILTISTTVLVVLIAFDVYKNHLISKSSDVVVGGEVEFVAPLDEVRLHEVLNAYHARTQLFEQMLAAIPESSAVEEEVGEEGESGESNVTPEAGEDGTLKVPGEE